MQNTKKLPRTLLTIALSLSFSGAAVAQERCAQPDANRTSLTAAYSQFAGKPKSALPMGVPKAPEPAKIRTEIRRLPLTDAKATLESTEGSAWHVLMVQVPEVSCAKKKAAELVECRDLLKRIKAAEKYAKAANTQIFRSALYKDVRVVITNLPKVEQSSDQKAKSHDTTPPSEILNGAG